MNGIILFNPKSAVAKHRIPNAIMNIAASVNGTFPWVIVDGNREEDPYQKIKDYLDTGSFKYLGFTVMPGPQTKQAIPFSKKIKEDYPQTVMIWGGYFPTSHFKVALNSGYVDFIINGPGDHAFPRLIHALENNEPYELIKNLIYRFEDKVIKTIKEDLIEQATLPALPYDQLDALYPIEKYLGKTYLGNKTLAYH